MSQEEKKKLQGIIIRGNEILGSPSIHLQPSLQEKTEVIMNKALFRLLEIEAEELLK